MIIMINGAFGVGKTTASENLKDIIHESLIFDPEEVGFMLRNIIPKSIKREHENTGDFQDLDLWRKLFVTVASEVQNNYGKHLIIPMTIRKAEYFDYIYSNLRKQDNDIYHFCLRATKETIANRLEVRGEEPGCWAYQQIDLCIEGLNKLSNTIYIDTDNKEPQSIIEEIMMRIEKSNAIEKEKTS